MPEQGKIERILSGETTITPSSDAAIEERLRQIYGERAGLPNPPVVIDLPFATSVIDNDSPAAADAKVPGKIVRFEGLRGLKANYSRCGQALRDERMDNLHKKAA